MSRRRDAGDTDGIGRPDKSGGILEIEAGSGTTVELDEDAGADESDATECDGVEIRWSEMASSMSSPVSAAYRQLISSGISVFNSCTRRY